MQETEIERLSRKIAHLEQHIINLIIPLQSINEIQRLTEAVEALCDKSRNYIKGLDIAFSQVALKTRCSLEEYSVTIEQLGKKIDSMDIPQAFSEIKYIGNRLSAIEKEILDIKYSGIKSRLVFAVEGTEPERIVHPDCEEKRDTELLMEMTEDVKVRAYLGILVEHGKILTNVTVGKILKKSPASVGYDRMEALRVLKKNKDTIRLIKTPRIRALLNEFLSKRA